MASRKISDLLPGTQAKVNAWLADCKKEIQQEVFIVSTYRSQEEQDSLWAKGRTAPGPIVTWTKRSMHTQRRAVDFALKQPNPWDLKADYDSDSIPDFLEAGRLAEKHGLQWGVRNRAGQRVDLGHIQDNEIYEVQQ